MEPVVSPVGPPSQLMLQDVVDTAWAEAIRLHPPLELLGGSTNSLRLLMRHAVDEAVSLGVINVDQLTLAAISVIPRVRRPK